ncbi:25.3 kDa vesicle transport protein [Tanacetum coccineum]
MVKLTIVGRVNDGLPLSQGPIYHDDDDDNTVYKQHAEFLLREISVDALPTSNTTIFLHHHCFNYMVKNGVCFITLCDVSYPRKLAFHYLQDLQKEFEKIDLELVNQITEPYNFLKLDNIICSIRRQYVDARTQANLSKLNNHRQAELDVHIEQMSIVVERRRKAGYRSEVDTERDNHLRSCICSSMEQL